jgi:hypothetical protein
MTHMGSDNNDIFVYMFIIIADDELRDCKKGSKY